MKNILFDLTSRDRLITSMTDTKRALASHTRTHPDFIRLNKPYRRVKGYESYSNVAMEMALLISVADDVGISRFNQTQKEVIYCAKYAATYGAPVYWLDEGLMQAFLQTELPKDISSLRTLVPMMIVMLPPLLKTPDGEPVKFLMFNYLDGCKPSETMYFGRETLVTITDSSQKLRWATILDSGVNYCSTCEIDGDSLIHGDWKVSEGLSFLDFNTDTPTELEFTALVDRIHIHTLFYLMSNGSAAFSPVDAADIIIPQAPRGFKRAEKKEENFLNPVWIGKNYQIRRRKANAADVEAARKNQIHTQSWWRRGHYRHQPVGKRENGETKLIWIPPIFITR